MNLIEVDNLTKDYGHGRGVFDVSFAVQKGETFGFLGPNGAGKTTTIRHIMGFSRPQSGRTLVFGKESFSRYFEILGDVGYLPGEVALPQGLRGDEFLQMMSGLRGGKSQRKNELLNLFALNPKQDVKKMSLGDKRKLAIVSAFMSDPDVLILDEPTSGLDPIMQETFVAFIREEKARKKTILLSSHIFREVDLTCDRISIIKEGKIVDNFVADDKKRQEKCFSVAFASAEGAQAFCRAFANARRTKNVVSVGVSDEELSAFFDALAKEKVKKIERKQFSLEDYFMRFYDNEKFD